MVEEKPLPACCTPFAGILPLISGEGNEDRVRNEYCKHISTHLIYLNF
jgi:hypothetical protein